MSRQMGNPSRHFYSFATALARAIRLTAGAELFKGQPTRSRLALEYEIPVFSREDLMYNFVLVGNDLRLQVAYLIEYAEIINPSAWDFLCGQLANDFVLSFKKKMEEFEVKPVDLERVIRTSPHNHAYQRVIIE